MQMRVGIDISAIPYSRGVSRYFANLVHGLWELQTTQDLSLKLLGRSIRQQDALRAYVDRYAPGTPLTVLPFPVRAIDFLWNTAHLISPELFMGELDVFHSWEIQPPLRRAASVSTIHDLAMLRYPQTADPYVLDMNKRSWQHLKKEAREIIAVSEATKKDIVELLGIEPNRISVVYEALADEAKIIPSKAESDRVLQRFSLKKPYIFFVGTTEPRKNLRRLVEAWRPLKKDYDLVIAGAEGWEELPEGRGVYLLGFVTNEQLAALYSRASVLAYPSLYEGFGLPILDAFYHKVPVVTSNVSSMPEVAGDAAVFIEPCDVEGIRAGIETALKTRKSLVEKGTRQLKKFSSWKLVAEQTIEVYRKAV